MSGEADDVLIEVGQLLFGLRWQSDLARALGASDRMVRYWLSGSSARPSDLNDRLATLLEERVGRMHDVVVRLRTSGIGESNK
ncbi:hypothetical protein CA237_01105 [Sphingomonas sp. ABOLH]|nr:hypothetical protein CA237_01105 [Sphingomonas sp. ABOLH]